MSVMSFKSRLFTLVSRHSRPAVTNKQVFNLFNSSSSRSFGHSVVVRQNIAVESRRADMLDVNTQSESEKKEDSNASSVVSADDKFTSLVDTGLVDEGLVKALHSAQYFKMTPTQTRSVIPVIKLKTGLVCRAKTGTGKTLAFIIPTLQAAIEMENRGSNAAGVQALIIAPTRDLAMQIEKEYQKILRKLSYKLKKNLHVSLCIGQKDFEVSKYVSPSIIIATPGKLNSSLDIKKVAHRFRNLKYRVYDEADRLLDQGFADTLGEIDAKLRRTHMSEEVNPFKSVLFSATVDDRVSSFCEDQIGKEYNFIDTIDPNEPEAHTKIEQSLVVTNDISESFNAALFYLVKKLSDPKFKGMVFLPTITSTVWFHEMLSKLEKISGNRDSLILLIHGAMTQGLRNAVMRRFKLTSRGILICTDVAARGLDIPNVSHVIQMTPSREVADFVHKVGRTARAGKSGKAVLFLSKLELPYKKVLENERGIKFTNEFECVLSDEERQMLDKVQINHAIVDDFISKFLATYGLISKFYHINSSKAIAQIMSYYRYLLKDPEAKLQTDKRFLRNIGVPSTKEMEEYFDAPGFFFSRDSNNRRSKMGSFSQSRNKFSSNRDRFRDNNSSSNFRSGSSSNRDRFRDGNFNSNFRSGSSSNRGQSGYKSNYSRSNQNDKW